jgi:hypothetical protein
MSDAKPTAAFVEGAAQELHALATQGQSWNTAGPRDQEHFKTIVRQVIDAGRTNELARSKRPKVLPR